MIIHLLYYSLKFTRACLFEARHFSIHFRVGKISVYFFGIILDPIVYPSPLTGTHSAPLMVGVCLAWKLQDPLPQSKPSPPTLLTHISETLQAQRPRLIPQGLPRPIISTAMPRLLLVSVMERQPAES